MPDKIDKPTGPLNLSFMFCPEPTKEHICAAFQAWSREMLKEYSYPATPETLEAVKKRTVDVMKPENFVDVQVPGEYTTKHGEKFSISIKVPEFLVGRFE